MGEGDGGDGGGGVGGGVGGGDGGGEGGGGEGGGVEGGGDGGGGEGGGAGGGEGGHVICISVRQLGASVRSGIGHAKLFVLPLIMAFCEFVSRQPVIALLSSVGSVPDSELPKTFRSDSVAPALSNPICVGNVPEKDFWWSMTCSRFVSWPIRVGIVPESELP